MSFNIRDSFSLAHSLKISVIVALGLIVTACSSSYKSDDSPNKINMDEDQYKQEEITHNAEVFFGKGAKGVGQAIERLFSRFGEPNSYMTGSEAGAGLIVGVRYGNGDLYHKIEGKRPVHWTGPSIGLDVGADTAKVFTLIYNLYDTEDIYGRFGAIEGQFFIVGGAGVSIHKKGDIVIAQVRLGVGLRTQLSAGYLKFTHKRSLLPL